MVFSSVSVNTRWFEIENIPTLIELKIVCAVLWIMAFPNLQRLSPNQNFARLSLLYCYFPDKLQDELHLSVLTFTAKTRCAASKVSNHYYFLQFCTESKTAFYFRTATLWEKSLWTFQSWPFQESIVIYPPYPHNHDCLTSNHITRLIHGYHFLYNILNLIMFNF